MSKLLDKANSKENREAFLNRISKKAGHCKTEYKK